MKSIKEAAAATGISEQNIRYYEKQGLIHPSRNSENSYREYDGEDIARLKTIRLFRKLDMPVSQIRSLLDGNVTLEQSLSQHLKCLEAEKDRIEAAIQFCSRIEASQLADLDVDRCLAEIEDEEKRGSVFARFSEDYKAVIQAEQKRAFSFMPDAPCSTPEEFAEELQKFARTEGLDLVITRIGMPPRFEINGIEYKARRASSRFGIVIHCEMVHPEDYIPEKMTEKQYRRYRFLSVIALPILLFLGVVLIRSRDFFSGIQGLLALIPLLIVFAAYLSFLYYTYGKHFKG